MKPDAHAVPGDERTARDPVARAPIVAAPIELVYQLTKSSHCHYQVARQLLHVQNTDQRKRCDTEQAGKKSNEKINKQINLDCGGRFAQRTHHQVVQSMTHTPATVNNPKQ